MSITTRGTSNPRPRQFAATGLLLALALTTASSVQSATLLGGTLSKTVGAVVDLTTGLIAALPIRVPGLAIPARATATIDGSKGGVVKCGRFQVTVPPGAFAGSADVTVYVPDGSTLACDLSISPASANGFSRPVWLQMDASGVTVDGGLLVGYWDPALAKWTRVPASWDNPTTKIVTAPLWHFSKYGGIPTRAGW